MFDLKIKQQWPDDRTITAFDQENRLAKLRLMLQASLELVKSSEINPKENKINDEEVGRWNQLEYSQRNLTRNAEIQYGFWNLWCS